MKTTTYNPYKFADEQFTNGLDFIAVNLPANPTFDDVITILLTYFGSLPDPVGPDGQAIMKVMIPNTANDYINSKIGINLNFNEAETQWVEAVLKGIKEESIDGMGEFLEAALEQLAQADINTISKTALYLGLGLANASQAYWQNVVSNPGVWSMYVNDDPAINYINIPHYTLATFMGSFSGFAQLQAPNMGPADVANTQGRLNALQNAICTALALTAGKVIFKWAKRPVVLAGAI